MIGASVGDRPGRGRESGEPVAVATAGRLSVMHPNRAGPIVSVVIPALRDSAELGALLDDLRADLGDARVEAVVVNGDASDRSMCAVRGRQTRVRWIDSKAGRGRQMNAGAEASSGRWLLFLHADARLDANWVAVIEDADRRSRIVGGAFRLALASSRRLARIIERGVAARTRWLRLPYGDQAFFVRREAFDAVGGYRPLPLMEDVEFIRRLGRRGQLWFPPVAVRVSARRWERDGWVRRTVSNLVLVGLYFAGVPVRWLARWYGASGTAGPEADTDTDTDTGADGTAAA